MSNRTRPYFIVTYLVSWAFLIPLVVLWRTVLNRQLPWWVVVFLPGAYGPSIAALVMQGREDGHPGMMRLLSSLRRWRVPVHQYVFVLGLPFGLAAMALLLSSYRSVALARLDLTASLRMLPVAFAVALPFGPLGEELGWRGYALPRLLATSGPWIASLTLGVVWTFWHLPMFWFPGAAIPSFLMLNGEAVVLYLIQTTATACIFTYVFVRSAGSVLLTILLHLTFNTADSILLEAVPAPTMAVRREIYLLQILLTSLAGIGLLTRIRGGPDRDPPAA